MAQDSDPVRSGFITSLARPGGNITGLSSMTPEISGKQLELLKEIVPKLARVAVFGTSARAGTAQALKEAELAAAASGVQVQYHDVKIPDDIEKAFQAVSKARAGAAIVLTSPIFTAHRTRVTELAIAGGLLFYGVSIGDLFRRAAYYVDKILKGAKPADLPVEQPTRFELAINLKAAKQIGLVIPPNVLARADKVIK
jgi:putative ABC transport system substrate-binding protein